MREDFICLAWKPRECSTFTLNLSKHTSCDWNLLTSSVVALSVKQNREQSKIRSWRKPLQKQTDADHSCSEVSPPRVCCISLSTLTNSVFWNFGGIMSRKLEMVLLMFRTSGLGDLFDCAAAVIL